MRYVRRAISPALWASTASLLLAACASSPPETARVAGPEAAAPTLAVSTAWLAAHLEDPDVVVIHVDLDMEAYGQGHVPGARFLALGDIVDSTDLPKELPDPALLESAFEDVGVSDDTHVVLYGGMGGLAPARALFTLAWMGHEDRVSMLDGGLEKWRAEGRPVEQASPKILVGDLTVEPRDDLVVDADWIEANRDEPGVVIVDVRPAVNYTGEEPGEGIARGGHIPGARSLPWTRNLAEADGPTLKDPDALWELWIGEAGADPEGTVVTYCRTGMMGSYGWFVARFLGLPAKLYDGSFADWSAREDLPVETGSGAVE